MLLSGAKRVPVTDKILRAGPLRLIFREGVFRYIKLGESEIVRAVYFAVRDEDWRTIPGILSNLDIQDLPDSFKISYDCTHREGGIDFRWKAEVTGNADGTIVWRMDGRAFTSFQKNRIGICVLHPLDESLGKSCQITHANGTIEHCYFPVVVAPHQPFMDVAAMSFRVNSNLDADSPSPAMSLKPKTRGTGRTRHSKPTRHLSRSLIQRGSRKERQLARRSR